MFVILPAGQLSMITPGTIGAIMATTQVDITVIHLLIRMYLSILIRLSTVTGAITTIGTAITIHIAQGLSW